MWGEVPIVLVVVEGCCLGVSVRVRVSVWGWGWWWGWGLTVAPVERVELVGEDCLGGWGV